MTEPKSLELRIFEGSHAGMKGKTNEDRVGYRTFFEERHPGIPITLAVLCDGIGGHSAGEVAADLALQTIISEVSQANLEDPTRVLENGIQVANHKVFLAAQQDRMRTGMGTTCACALIRENQLFISYVGDSRIYLQRRRSLSQLSKDHTWIQEALDGGLLSQEEASDHPNRHVLRRYLGSATPPMVDSGMHFASPDEATAKQLPLQTGDIILLCSDGLTDLVSDPEINQLLKRNTPKVAIQKLIALANQRGGHDNISILLLKVEKGKKVKGGSKRWLANCLMLFILSILLAIGMLIGINVIEDQFNPSSTQSVLVTLPFPTQTPLPLFDITIAPVNEVVTGTVSPQPTETITATPSAASPTDSIYP